MHVYHTLGPTTSTPSLALLKLEPRLKHQKKVFQNQAKEIIKFDLSEDLSEDLLDSPAGR